MALDFRANQVRTNKIISSGSTGTQAEIIIYSYSGSSDQYGGINTSIFSTAGIGSDIFLFISGAINSKNVADSHGTTVFGGDVFISGSITTLGGLTGSGGSGGSASDSGSLQRDGSRTLTQDWNAGSRHIQNISGLTINATTGAHTGSSGRTPSNYIAFSAYSTISYPIGKGLLADYGLSGIENIISHNTAGSGKVLDYINVGNTNNKLGFVSNHAIVSSVNIPTLISGTIYSHGPNAVFSIQPFGNSTVASDYYIQKSGVIEATPPQTYGVFSAFISGTATTMSYLGYSPENQLPGTSLILRAGAGSGSGSLSFIAFEAPYGPQDYPISESQNTYAKQAISQSHRFYGNGVMMMAGNSLQHFPNTITYSFGSLAYLSDLDTSTYHLCFNRSGSFERILFEGDVSTGDGSSIFTLSGIQAKTTCSVAFDSDNRYPSAIGSDVWFYVSGSAANNKAAFGIPLVASGGLSGSLTRLTDNSPYLVAGPNITISTQSNGAVAISGSAGGGGGGGDGGASYLIITSTASLAAGRTLSASYGIEFTDGGPGGNFSVGNRDRNTVYFITGTTVNGNGSELASIPILSNSISDVNVQIVAKNETHVDRARFIRNLVVFRSASNDVSIQDDDIFIPILDKKTANSWNVNFSSSAGNLIVNITGSATSSVDWQMSLKVFSL